MSSFQAKAQWLPPVNFTSPTTVCDTTPWKLVFYDGFDGTTLNDQKWVKFNHWNGLESEDWAQGRNPYPGNHSVIEDENVVLSGGTVKLKVKQKTTTWQCATCKMEPYTKNYTSAYISTRYSNAFNSGRIEAKLKMPKFKGSWATCWTWGTRINEIDFAESWGGTNGHEWPHIGDRPRNTYSVHAWAPQPESLNVYKLPDPVSISNSYPNQSWWDWLSGTSNRHKQEEWHTYVCEWDTASIKTYLDGEHIKTIWKYYQNRLVSYNNGSEWINYNVKVPSGCSPISGTWNITEGFPYSNYSQSKIVFSVGMTIPEKVLSKDGELGQMEIDYVKVYQRHPELEGRKEIYNIETAKINHSKTKCETTIHETSSIASGGICNSSNNAENLAGSSLERNFETPQADPNVQNTSSVISYTNTPTDSPPENVSKTKNIDSIKEVVIVTRNLYEFNQNFNLWASPNIPGATYSWKVWYGELGLNLNYYEASGNYISIPKINRFIDSAYDINWELTIITAYGSKTINGGKSNLISDSITVNTPPNLSNPYSFVTKDSTALYLETKFTEKDSMLYVKIVRDIIASQFVENIYDTLAIATMIGKIRVEALEPYLYFETKNDNTAITKIDVDNNKNEIAVSKLHPNSRKNITALNHPNTFLLKIPNHNKAEMNAMGNNFIKRILQDLNIKRTFSNNNFRLNTN